MKKKKIQIKNMIKAPTSKKLIEKSNMDLNTLFKEMNTSYNGLSENLVEIIRKESGSNEISHEKKDPIIKRLFDAFINPFTSILLILAAISFYTDVILVSEYKRDLTAVIIILTMVTISGLLQYFQESSSNSSAEKLKAMVHTTVAVIREGTGKYEIPLSEIVPGDIVCLAAGDIVPADVRIIYAKDLFVSQSSLTGESEPVEKFVTLRNQNIVNNAVNPLEIENLAFMGSNVVSGSAICLCFATGDSTYFGSMAEAITKKRVKTSFDEGVSSVNSLLIRLMVLMVPFVLFINGFTKGDWLEAFLFALSVAVGLTPEMLPMIVTANLAKGAISMSKHKTVVKQLNSMQNFGAMDVLCTDKTGTLTKDQVILELHLDIHGNENDRVLHHAFLNSYYQTGLRNLLDVAILESAVDKDFYNLLDIYEKIDEIPFDFNRRRMSVVLRDREGKTQLITKGAVEEMLSVSGYVEYNDEILEVTDEIRNEIFALISKYNSDGMRVIAVAQKTNPSAEEIFSAKDESDMVLMGFLAFLDPPKETASSAIKALNECGVAVKILTGDNDTVTRYICKSVGLPIENIVLGTNLDDMSDEHLKEIAETTSVFAKLSPQQKLRIVKILRSNGHTVG